MVIKKKESAQDSKKNADIISLIFGADEEKVEKFKKALENHKDFLNYKDKDGSNILQITIDKALTTQGAEREKYYSIIESLIKTSKNANINLVDYNGSEKFSSPPLLQALEKKDVTIIKMLLKYYEGRLIPHSTLKTFIEKMDSDIREELSIAGLYKPLVEILNNKTLYPAIEANNKKTTLKYIENVQIDPKGTLLYAILFHNYNDAQRLVCEGHDLPQFEEIKNHYKNQPNELKKCQKTFKKLEDLVRERGKLEKKHNKKVELQIRKKLDTFISAPEDSHQTDKQKKYLGIKDNLEDRYSKEAKKIFEEKASSIKGKEITLSFIEKIQSIFKDKREIILKKVSKEIRKTLENKSQYQENMIENISDQLKFKLAKPDLKKGYEQEIEKKIKNILNKEVLSEIAEEFKNIISKEDMKVFQENFQRVDNKKKGRSVDDLKDALHKLPSYKSNRKSALKSRNKEQNI